MYKFAVVICAAVAFPQIQQPLPVVSPEFEVASVKPSTTRERGGVYTYPGGRVAFRGCTLHYLIEQAFDLHTFQISGGPDWIRDDRYDIDAKVPEASESSRSRPSAAKTAPILEQRKMLQSLLAERFQLRYRRESRDGLVYLLVKGNKALKLMEPKDKNAYPWAGGIDGGMIVGNGLAGINVAMEDFAKRLGRYLGRPVMNRTGIVGSYDFRSEYSADNVDTDVISMIITSVQDIGLKLQGSKASVDGLVIEHAEKASGN